MLSPSWLPGSFPKTDAPPPCLVTLYMLPNKLLHLSAVGVKGMKTTQKEIIHFLCKTILPRSRTARLPQRFPAVGKPENLASCAGPAVSRGQCRTSRRGTRAPLGNPCLSPQDSVSGMETRRPTFPRAASVAALRARASLGKEGTSDISLLATRRQLHAENPQPG